MTIAQRTIVAAAVALALAALRWWLAVSGVLPW